MGSISVRRIDENTLQRLRERAAQHGVSMEEEVRRILQEAVAGRQRLGDLALATFGPDHGVEVVLPQHQSHGPVDFDQ